MAILFPFIDSVALITQLPYGEVDEWCVLESSLECGQSFTRPENTAALKTLKLSYSSITKAELVVLETFFNSMRGKTGEFQISIPAGDVIKTYGRCHFDQDSMRVSYPGPGQYSTDLKIAVLPS